MSYVIRLSRRPTSSSSYPLIEPRDLKTAEALEAAGSGRGVRRRSPGPGRQHAGWPPRPVTQVGQCVRVPLVTFVVGEDSYSDQLAAGVTEVVTCPKRAVPLPFRLTRCALSSAGWLAGIRWPLGLLDSFPDFLSWLAG